MSALVNVNWLDVNSLRNYPLDDSASRLSDANTILPNDILVDANIWFPGNPGDRVYLSSAATTSGLVSLTFCLNSGGTFVPLASVVVAKPVQLFHNYPLVPYVPGVAGWVCFGGGAANDIYGSWTFSTSITANNALLLPRAAHPYSDAGAVTSIFRTGYASKYTGIIKIVNRTPDLLNISGQCVTLPGNANQCYVVGNQLGQRAIVFTLVQPTGTTESIFTTLAGPCGGTPDSNTCRQPAIRSINGAVPDCSGNIYIQFVEDQSDTGSGQLLNVTADGSGIALNYELGMTSACPPKTSEAAPDQVDNCDQPCVPWSGSSPFSTNS